MKIKEVQAGVKISRNYNSYSVNLIADIEDKENPEKIGSVLIEKAREIVLKEILRVLKIVKFVKFVKPVKTMEKMK